MEAVHLSQSNLDCAEPWRSRDLAELGPPEPRRRILYVVGQLSAGGLEQQICYLLQGMDRERHRPVLAVWNFHESDFNVPKIRALEVPICGFPLEASSRHKLQELIRLSRSLRPGVVHSYSFFTNFAAYVAARASGAVGVGSVRAESNAASMIKAKPVLGRLSAALPRCQISNSHAAVRRGREISRWFSPGEFVVVSNGLDLERFPVRPLPMNPPHTILGVGSLVPKKRWDRLLRLGRELKERNVPMVIEIAGEGGARSELEALASHLEVQDVVHFLGRRGDMPTLMARARLVVHTSDAEGTPNAVMEALASGRPVVATDVGDVARIVAHGRTGFVVPPDDSAGLLERVMEVLNDDALAARLGAAARAYAEREFGLTRLVAETLAVYRAAGWKAG